MESILDRELKNYDYFYISEEYIRESMLNTYKRIDETFIYKMSDGTKYTSSILRFIQYGKRVDTKAAEFKDVEFDIKRRNISDALVKVLRSPNLVLAIGPEPLNKPLKVLTAKDITDNSKYKLFLDVFDYFRIRNGVFECTNIDWFISYLIAGIVNYIYVLQTDRLMMDQVLISKGTVCFVRLFSYIVDNLVKITSIPILKMKVDYLAAIYYHVNLLLKDFTSESSKTTIRNNAIKASGISDMDARAVDLLINDDDFADIDHFVKALTRILNLNLTTTAVIARWMDRFQSGTQFGLEYYPAFSSMLTHTYFQGFLVNQNLIKSLLSVDNTIYSKQIIQVVEGAVS